MTLIIEHLSEKPRIAVLGGHSLSLSAKHMARLIGQEIIRADCCLLTGGRSGAGEETAKGARAVCIKKDIDPNDMIFSLVPENQQADFMIGSCINIGHNKTGRRIALVRNTIGAIIIGGGKGTLSEIYIAVMQAIMDGYRLIPASGTGGQADRICATIQPFEDVVLNDNIPTKEKAKALVKRLLCSPCWYCDIKPVEAHDEWFASHKKNHVAKKMYKIRHEYF